MGEIQIHLVAVLCGYLLGAIPFGLLLTRLGGLGDIRQIGSGNIGATNVLRTGRKGLAVLTLILDGGKGAAAVLIAGQFAPDSVPYAAAAAFVGHLYPVWLGFKGGKGVATFLGILLAVEPLAGLASCATWLLTAFAFRYSSLAALVSALLSPLYTYFLGDGKTAFLAGTLAVLIFWRHKSNIARLTNGTEPRIGGSE